VMRVLARVSNPARPWAPGSGIAVPEQPAQEFDSREIKGLQGCRLFKVGIAREPYHADRPALPVQELETLLCGSQEMAPSRFVLENAFWTTTSFEPVGSRAQIPRSAEFGSVFS